ncbi:class I SAM-dependent methyltransferase [Miltoncostaea oceani]|uniref:class I SAM-dependent methyltransferase n=1 Tax=Miltoncostaea oceani TaxID=2843216 RepID=UPI001C3C250C|nr:class I SAM-dependent methyltransferase [Miltoncostaea oceani]
MRGIGDIIVSSRPYEEYRDMFGLTDAELLAGPVLDCPGGAGGFAAGLRARGGEVVSADPAYAEDPAALVARSRAGLEHGLRYLAENRDSYVWTWFDSAEDLAERRLGALDAFARDRRDLADPRYVPAALPDLPFADGAFRLALSGYLLFAYPDHLDPEAHEAALRELLRVAGEVRVYPLIDTAYVRYPGIDDLRSALERDGVASEVRRVDYAFQAGADEVLVLSRP